MKFSFGLRIVLGHKIGLALQRSVDSKVCQVQKPLLLAVAINEADRFIR